MLSIHHVLKEEGFNGGRTMQSHSKVSSTKHTHACEDRYRAIGSPRF
mgnify:CR=1 FL=1